MKIKYICTLIVFLFMVFFTLTPSIKSFYDTLDNTHPLVIAIGNFSFDAQTWSPNVTYATGDEVTYNGHTFVANRETTNDEPIGTNVGADQAWLLTQFVLDTQLATHLFDASVLNATITINGVIVVENGTTINSNFAAAGISTINSSSGGAYWSFNFAAGGSVRIRENGNIQYQQNPTFDSIIFDLN